MFLQTPLVDSLHPQVSSATLSSADPNQSLVYLGTPATDATALQYLALGFLLRLAVSLCVPAVTLLDKKIMNRV